MRVRQRYVAPHAVRRKAPLFWRNPFSYLFYFWYGPILRLVSPPVGIERGKPWMERGQTSGAAWRRTGGSPPIRPQSPAATLHRRHAVRYQHAGSPPLAPPGHAPPPSARRAQGYRRTLQYEDVFDIPDAIFTDKVYPVFNDIWKDQIKGAEEGGAKARPRPAAACAWPGL